MSILSAGSLLGVLLLGADPTQTQDSDLQARMRALELENAELARRIDAVAAEQEGFTLGELAPPIGATHHGLGPAASKVYGVSEGLSIGGYGEFVFADAQGGPDLTDAQRLILYVGYRFSEKWLLNSEIEVEHADEIFLEFAHLDYLNDPALNGRVGLLLHPMGFINEQHEPTTYLGATRPLTETRIIPTTWRANGAGLFGETENFSYRAYALTGLDALGFSAEGLRGGRQKGSRSRSDDFALTARLDYVGRPGLLAGVSAFVGDAGQDRAGLDDTATTILDAHAEWKADGLWLRGLVAMATVDDVAQLNAAKGLTGADSVGEEQLGFYLEAGFDVLSLSDSQAKLYPYVRYESVDTQRDVPTGFSSSSANDLDVWTVGLHFKPIDNIAIKIDYQDYDSDLDSWNIQIGYSF